MKKDIMEDCKDQRVEYYFMQRLETCKELQEQQQKFAQDICKDALNVVNKAVSAVVTAQNTIFTSMFRADDTIVNAFVQQRPTATEEPPVVPVPEPAATEEPPHIDEDVSFSDPTALAQGPPIAAPRHPSPVAESKRSSSKRAAAVASAATSRQTRQSRGKRTGPKRKRPDAED